MKKLQNKKTGEMGYLIVGKGCDCYTVANDNWESCGKYDSLSKLNEEWEDYEEPKEWWFVDAGGEISETTYLTEDDKRSLANFGNYFETKEEAEKAVEKLKAWKRLKDKGFKFEGIKEDYTRILQSQEPFRTGKRYLQFNKSEDEEWMKENWEDLDLIFGGRE